MGAPIDPKGKVRDDEWGTPKLTQKYLRGTPGQYIMKFSEFLSAYRADVTPIVYKYRK